MKKDFLLLSVFLLSVSLLLKANLLAEEAAKQPDESLKWEAVQDSQDDNAMSEKTYSRYMSYLTECPEGEWGYPNAPYTRDDEDAKYDDEDKNEDDDEDDEKDSLDDEDEDDDEGLPKRPVRGFYRAADESITGKKLEKGFWSPAAASQRTVEEIVAKTFEDILKVANFSKNTKYQPSHAIYLTPTKFHVDMKTAGKVAIPYLLENLDNDSILYIDPTVSGDGEFMYLRSVGYECREALIYIMESDIPIEFRDGSRIPDGKSGYKNFHAMFQYAPAQQIRDWFQERKDKSLLELQKEIIEYHIATQKRIGPGNSQGAMTAVVCLSMEEIIAGLNQCLKDVEKKIQEEKHTQSKKKPKR